MRTRKILAFTLLFSLLVVSECLAAFPEIQFGRFYRDKDLQPIECLILDETADSYLLLAKHCIDQQPYNVKRVNTTWETCTLRQWLNGEFLRTAFTQQEQQGLTVTLLTAEEVVKYLPSASMRQCSPTSYARNRGVYINGRGDCAWWTRSPGNSPIEAAYLSSAGDFGTRTHYVDDDVIGLRPAVWVKKNIFRRL